MKKNLLLLFIIFIPVLLSAQTLNRNYVTTNGPVRAIVQSGDTAYIGGDFTQLGLQSRGIAQFTPGNTKPDISFPQLGVSSTVNCITPDDNGGFYIAGRFKNFNGIAITSNTKILHVLNDGSLDASFNAVTADGDILCMKESGSKLYVGGSFNTIQNTSKPFVAAIDATTGAIDSWTPAAPDNIVEQIDVSNNRIFIEGANISSIGGYDTPTHFGAIRTADGVYVNDFPTVNNIITGFTVSGTTLYIAGDFNQAGPGASGVAKLSAADAGVDADFPPVNGNVFAILPDGSGGYYIGGSFTKVGNKSRKNLAHIFNDGTVDAAFNVTVNNDVLCLTSDNTNIYFGGNFTTINGTARKFAAAVSKTDGGLTSWNPAPDSSVLTMARINNIICMGGWFTSVKSTPRNFAAAITTSNGLNSWDPEPNYYVNQIITNSSGTSLFMCGAFTTVNGKAHEYIAKVNKSGSPVAWRPQPDNVVKSIALNGSTIYLGGSFTSINGIAKQFLAAIDTTSNSPTSLQADLNNYPNCINIAAGKLYVAGNFSEIQNQNISYISRIDLSSGIVDSWNPVSNAYTGVVFSDGTDVIAGGNFTLMNGIQKNNVAAINLSTSTFTDWSANGVAAFNVNSISKIITSGNDVFIGGDFNYFDGFNTVYNLLIIDNTLGNISHLLTQYPVGNVTQLSIFDNKLIAGGNFSNVFDINSSSNISRKNITAYNQSDYTLSSSVYDANAGLNGMFITASNNLIISGNFSLLNYVNRNYLAAISLNTKQVLPFDPSPDNIVYALAVSNNTLFAGGVFKNIGNAARNFVVSINTSTGNINSAWNTNCDSTVYALSTDGSLLYMGGLFTSVKGSSRLHAAVVATTGGAALKSWAPDADSVVTAINTVNGLYVGGNFTHIKTSAKNYLAKTTTQGSATSWNPKPNNSVLSFAADSNTIYVGGNSFTSISGKTRNALAAYTISNNALTTFDAKLKINNTAPQVNALALNGNVLYIGTTALDSVNGISGGRLAAINTTNNSALTFNPLPDSAVLALSASNNYLLAGGVWNSLGDSISPSYFAVFTVGTQLLSAVPVITNIITKQEELPVAIVYPNPATNIATIDFKKEVHTRVSLINNNGKTLWIKNDFAGSQFQFSVQGLSSGTYFILIEAAGKLEKLKLVKE